MKPLGTAAARANSGYAKMIMGLPGRPGPQLSAARCSKINKSSDGYPGKEGCAEGAPRVPKGRQMGPAGGPEKDSLRRSGWDARVSPLKARAPRALMAGPNWDHIFQRGEGSDVSARSTVTERAAVK